MTRRIGRNVAPKKVLSLVGEGCGGQKTKVEKEDSHTFIKIKEACFGERLNKKCFNQKCSERNMQLIWPGSWPIGLHRWK